MKVLKFGGTSVGSIDSILSVKKIVSEQNEPVIVVVSALGGVTDQLIRTAQLAHQGDTTYQQHFDAIVRRHNDMIAAIIDDMSKRGALLEEVDSLLQELRSIYHGVFLIRDLSPKTQAAIVSYGERISSRIVATLISGSVWYDSRDMIKTEDREGRRLLATDTTYRLVREAFTAVPKVSVMGGFISTDVHSGEVTNLGRGGSDYTASIIAAALDAEILEIWTDVDGFMTADPRVIRTAYTIPQLSYIEAMELCNFGAKVVYPPTIYPVCRKNIPILIKNTFNPDAAGTIIKSGIEDDGKPIKGISSINGTSIITVSGLSMVGVIGVNRRIFTALADNGISVFMVSQTSSENSTSIGVREEDAERACDVLNAEFAKEIEQGSMFRNKAIKGLAAVAIVGENMKHTPGIAGKLFGTLGRSGISVIACAQGASETNISFVIDSAYLRKTLNVIHDSFFLSEYQELNVILCGVGTVGRSLLSQITAQREKLMRERRLKVNVVGLATSRKAVFSRDGLDLTNIDSLLANAQDSNVERLRSEVVGMNIFNSVFVDCTASAEVAGLYKDLLNHNINVVAANKVAASSDYDNYHELKQIALTRGVKFLFETNVGAGLPIIRTINDLRNSGDKILCVEAVLSGTLNFIFNNLSATVPFSKAVRMASDAGYAEPDPRIDLSGKDVLRKLVILARESGYRIEQQDVEVRLFVPDSLFEGTLEDFWTKLPSADAEFERRRLSLESKRRRYRFVASFDAQSSKARVSLQEIEYAHPFYELDGSNNIVLLTTERYHEYPMLIQGYGAGAGVTAAGVFADIMSVANI